ncbi:glucose PTS transporter subunit IIA [Corynebacterium guangdongense]|uniref:PTS system beta-glucosides-specific IIC component n=1 Tax=Corynebacterium guangdongense TaxID=1783348 RepID=A0ABU1ZVK4_9CORY|nr:glucose PTS transporter subunit IIA [Corynebacterium guangdongense]MDR7328805.1 PTS system beta-glucosides-specific IIC component [Corynebacterium guangdongense]WJZ17380.1 PTS system beta-glucoside-specific EIIBCA component [Corynebacterium guangdongense]
MAPITHDQTSQAILDNLGGPDNVTSLTHCATRLRTEVANPDLVNDQAIESLPGVMGVMRQGGNRVQVIIGGGVESTYNAITNLPDWRNRSDARGQSDQDVKDAVRARAKGRYSWVDNFFEYLSDSFRPILGVLLGASLIIAFSAILDAFGVVDFRAEDKSASWVFVDAMWRSVFYFLPIMVAYNAAKKLRVDPWLGAAVMGALMTPEFMSLSDTERFAEAVCTVNETLGTESCATTVFGVPMQLNDYSGQVFVPLIMVAVLALLYHALKKVFPANVQMVFVPFVSLLVMIPLTAFLIGPLGVWLGNGIGDGLAWMNSNAPFIFALLIPMLYPFLVPLGLHWPLNALMLINIQTLGYDFIQGPMGAWNAACFGATAAVLLISLREKDLIMRQTSSGALAAGLLGGISEPSLYGIHLRFKRIYPRMLVGCFTGGLAIAILGTPYEGVKTSAFVFSSIFTIPVFDPMWVYALAYLIAFTTALAAVYFSDYRTAEQRAEAAALRELADERVIEAAESGATAVPAAHPEPVTPAAPTAGAATSASAAGTATAVLEAPTTRVLAPVDGHVVDLSEVDDKVFSGGTLGRGVGIVPTAAAGTVTVAAPVSGVLRTVADTGHAYGIKTDDGVEVLVHIGIDTVGLEGRGFESKVSKKQRVSAGDPLATVDFSVIREAGLDATTMLTVTNTRSLTSVEPVTGGDVIAGEAVIHVEK